MCLASLLDQQHLALFDAMNLHLPLLPILQIQSRNALELVFLCHNSSHGAKSGCLGSDRSSQLKLFAKEMSEADGCEIQRRVHGRAGGCPGGVLLLSAITQCSSTVWRYKYVASKVYIYVTLCTPTQQRLKPGKCFSQSDIIYHQVFATKLPPKSHLPIPNSPSPPWSNQLILTVVPSTTIPAVHICLTASSPCTSSA